MSAGSTLLHTARQAARPLARSVRRHVLPRILPPSHNRFPEAVQRVRVVGLLSSASGLGESARLCARALREAGHELATVDVAGLFASRDDVAYPVGTERPEADLAIYHMNPPMLIPSILRAGLRRHARTYSVGYWAWELETLPDEWVAALRFVDAVLVPSRFCRDAVQAATDKPVIVVPHPVEAAAAPAMPWGGADRFRVVSIFNFGSSFERKNPIAAIRAFRVAFGDDPTAELVLKVGDGHRYPAERARLVAAMGDAPNVRLIDEVWARERLEALLASAGAYLSLHRSEGFGLTLAEAILAGVPVVATDWSGNADFCSPDLSYPVGFTLVPFRDPHLAYAGMRDARWAEPDVADAARQLRRVRDEGAQARAKTAALGRALTAHLRRHSYAAALDRLREAGRPEARPEAA